MAEEKEAIMTAAEQLNAAKEAFAGCPQAQAAVELDWNLSQVNAQLSTLPADAAGLRENLTQQALGFQQGSPKNEAGTFWMPNDASNLASDVDMMYYAVLGLSAFFFVGITVAVIYFCVKYRHRPGHKPQPSATHNDLLEITWTIVPIIIVIFLFVGGWKGYLEMVTPNRHSVEITATAKKWGWNFNHQGANLSHLHVPRDEYVRVSITATDVLHSFNIPAFRVKKDAVPRRYTSVTFKPTKTGIYRLFCTEFCGQDHSQMKRLVFVHERACYRKYIESQLNVEPEVLGERIYNSQCSSCHSNDGSVKVGPSFKNLWGTQRAIADGTSVLADENYITESILNPGAKVRAGYPNSMAPQNLKPDQIQGVIAYLKSISDATEQPAEGEAAADGSGGAAGTTESIAADETSSANGDATSSAASSAGASASPAGAASSTPAAAPPKTPAGANAASSANTSGDGE